MYKKGGGNDVVSDKKKGTGKEYVDRREGD
jgi:hypothetical protein